MAQRKQTQDPTRRTADIEDYEVAKMEYEREKKKMGVEPLGSIRPLTEAEERFFWSASKIYERPSPMKSGTGNWAKKVPSAWDKHKNKFIRKRNAIFLMWRILEAASGLATRFCGNTQRLAWLKVFSPLGFPSREEGGFRWNSLTASQRETAFIIVVMFCKATNGTADRVVIPHFLSICRTVRKLSMKELVADPIYIARYLRQTSCWVKNTVAIHSLFNHLLMAKNLPIDFGTWMNFHEFQSKTVSLILYALTGSAPTVPVDRHVFNFFIQGRLSQATSTEELAYQLRDVFEPEDYVRVNDAIGSIAQYSSTVDGQKRIEIELEHLPKSISEVFQHWLHAKSPKNETK